MAITSGAPMRRCSTDSSTSTRKSALARTDISAILPAMSSDGGRAPVSALTITVRSNPSSRANWS